MFRSFDHPQGAYFCSLLKLQFNTLSDLLRYINLVLWQRGLFHITHRHAATAPN